MKNYNIFLLTSLAAAVASDLPLLDDQNPDISRKYGTSANNSGEIVADLLSLGSAQKTASILSEISGTLPKAFISSGVLLDYVLKTAPANGMLKNFTKQKETEQYTYTYVRNTNFFGDDLFTFTLKNGSSTANIVVVVSADNSPVPVNHVPVVKDDLIVGQEDTLITGVLPAFDDDGNNLTYKIVSKPANGLVNLDPATGKYTYTANNPNFSGDDSFTYQVDDGKGGVSNVATITVRVDPITGCEAFKKAFVQPKWGFWRCWSALKSFWNLLCCCW